jgi:hypothetical protein
MKVSTFLSAAVLAAVSHFPAYAAPVTYTAILSGPTEEPPNTSPGTGVVTVIVDEAAHTLAIQATFSGLLGTTTAAHIHVINGPGDANTSDTVGPVATTTPSFAGFPTGVTAGSFSSTLDTTLTSTYNPAFVTNAGGIGFAEAALFDAIEQGRAYFNIHTTAFPGGEIRGFLQADVVSVPEPGILGLVALGLVGIGALRRRRNEATSGHSCS